VLSPDTFLAFEIVSATPALAPSTGGSQITVQGRGFAILANATYACQWGVGARTTAVVIDSTRLTCATPTTPPTSVTVTTDNGATVAVPTLPFTTYPVPAVTAISPVSGPSAGSFEITLFGSGFYVPISNATTITRQAASDSYLRCGFGETAANPALLVTPMTAVCLVAAHPKGAYPVTVSLNGGSDVHPFPELLFSFSDCDPGFSAESSADPCTACPAGAFKPLPGPGLCQPCDTGAFSEVAGSANCTRCPANTAVFGADGSLRRHCLCERGFFHPDPTPGEPCLPCPDGGVCDGQLTMPRAKPGFWGSDTSAVFLQCDNAISCPGGDPGTCAEGHLGRMCAECADGWYSLEHLCRPCPDNAVWILVGVVAIALVLVVVFFRIVGKRIIAFAGVLRIVTKFFQVVALLSKMNLRWPSVVADTMRYTTSIFWLDPDVLASECSLRMFTFEVKWALTLSLPVVFALLFSGLYGILRAATKTPTQSLRNRIINAYLLLLSLGYILLASTALELFGCTRERDGQYVLDVDKSKFCFDAWWWSMLPYAAAAVVAYGLGIPLLFFLWFRANRNRVDETQFTERFHSLYSAYRTKRVHWEGVAMGEKLLYAVAARLLSSDVLFQAIVFIVLLVGSMSLHQSRQPFLRKADNVLHSVLYWCAILLLCAGLMFESNRFSTLTAREAAAGVAVAIIAIGIVAILYFVVREFLDVRRAEWKEIPDDVLALIDTHCQATGRKLVRHWLRRTADKRFWERRLARVLRAIGEFQDDDDAEQVAVADILAAEPHVSLFCSHVWLGVSLRQVSAWCLWQSQNSDNESLIIRDFRDVMAALARYSYTAHGAVASVVSKPTFSSVKSRGQSSVSTFGVETDDDEPDSSLVDTPAVRTMLCMLYADVAAALARATAAPDARRNVPRARVALVEPDAPRLCRDERCRQGHRCARRRCVWVSCGPRR
jgi:hypothetical protein